MVTSNFSIGEDLILTERHSGMQLEMVTDQEPAEDLPWIEGWFGLPNGNCVVQKFIVLETGNPSCHLVNEAVVFWGREVLDATLLSTQMSPEFSSSYLFPAIMQTQQVRWN
jgi:hypothetical protein